MKIAEWKRGLSEGLRSFASRWGPARRRDGGPITRYWPSRAPDSRPLDDADFVMRSPNWGLLAGEVFEDRDKVIVRLEAPGIEVKDFDLQVEGQALRVRGDKRSSRESREGAWRLTERAYGHFERVIRLPVPVRGEKASAAYRNGVLRIELPKVEATAPRRVKVQVH